MILSFDMDFSLNPDLYLFVAGKLGDNARYIDGRFSLMMHPQFDHAPLH